MDTGTIEIIELADVESVDPITVPQINNTSNSDTLKEEEKRSFEVYMKNSSWFYYYQTYISFSNVILIVPFRLEYDDESSRLVVRSNYWHKTVCMVLQLCNFFYMRSMILGQWDFIHQTTDKSSYIDMLMVLLISMYDLAFKWELWTKKEAFQIFFDELRWTPLLKIQPSLKPLMIKVVIYTVCVVYILTALCFVTLLVGVALTEATGLLDHLAAHAEVTLLLGSESRSSLYFPFLTAFATFITFYTSLFWHYADFLNLISTVFMFHVTRDVFTALKRGEVPQSEVLHYYDAYMRLNKKFNDAAGLFVTCFYPCLLPYYSTHFVDMLNDSDYRNRFSMAVYLTHLATILILGSKMNRMGRLIKHWMHDNRAYVQKEISEQRLVLILHDLKCDRIGINGLYAVTFGFTGHVVNLILTQTIITVQFKMKQ